MKWAHHLLRMVSEYIALGAGNALVDACFQSVACVGEASTRRREGLVGLSDRALHQRACTVESEAWRSKLWTKILINI